MRNFFISNESNDGWVWGQKWLRFTWDAPGTRRYAQSCNAYAILSNDGTRTLAAARPAPVHASISASSSNGCWTYQSFPSKYRCKRFYKYLVPCSICDSLFVVFIASRWCSTRLGISRGRGPVSWLPIDCNAGKTSSCSVI